MKIDKARGPDFTLKGSKLTFHFNVKSDGSLKHLEGLVDLTLSWSQMEHFVWDARNFGDNIETLLNDLLLAFPRLQTRSLKLKEDMEEDRKESLEIMQDAMREDVRSDRDRATGPSLLDDQMRDLMSKRSEVP